MLTHLFSRPQNPSRVIILGAGGFLGHRLHQSLTKNHIATIALGSRDIDLTKGTAGEDLREKLQPTDTVVFFSGVTPDKGRDSATLIRNLNMARSVCEAACSAQVSHM